MELTLRADNVNDMAVKIAELNYLFNSRSLDRVDPKPDPLQMAMPFIEEATKRNKPGKKVKVESGNGHDKHPPKPFIQTISGANMPLGKAVETPAATKEEAMAALQAVVSNKGLEAAKAVLEKFGAKRVSEVSEDQYAELIEACKNV